MTTNNAEDWDDKYWLSSSAKNHFHMYCNLEITGQITQGISAIFLTLLFWHYTHLQLAICLFGLIVGRVSEHLGSHFASKTLMNNYDVQS